MSEYRSVLRGYRPSRLTRYDSGEDEAEVVRLANLERYIMRARAGLPIFDDFAPPEASASPRASPGRPRRARR